MWPPPFQEFFDAHRDEVWRFLAAAVGPVDADDCFQETFIAALRAYPRLDESSDLRAWVLTIAHRKSIDLHRQARRGPPGDPEAIAAARAADYASAPASEGEEVWALVAELPERQRAAVALRFLGDMAHAEIARVLECTPEAARRSLHEGLRKLRTRLEAEVAHA